MAKWPMTLWRRAEIEDMLADGNVTNEWDYNVICELLEIVDEACSFTKGTCDLCGGVFFGRTSRRWCSEPCRSKAWRERKKSNSPT